MKGDPAKLKRVFMESSTRQQEQIVRKLLPGVSAKNMKGKRRYFIDKVLTFNLFEMTHWLPPRGVAQVYEVFGRRVSKRDIQAFFDVKVKMKALLDELEVIKHSDEELDAVG